MKGNLLGNRYKIIDKIGGGGMAVVYKARCLLLNRNVAIKVLRPEFVQDEELVKRFKFEAQSAASLSHPNIVPIYDVGSEDGNYYIVMEYVDGITLKEYIRSKGALDWEEAVKIAIQICSAMEHAHKNKIIHRDIKPQNILLTNDGIAKVADFGIARAATASTITMAGNTIGSVHYFSPEQARGGYTDDKSDLYSLGIVLYEMATGKVPFEADTPVAVAMMQVQKQPQDPMHLKRDIPEALNDLIMKAIRKDPGTRYQSASEMLSDLYQVLVEPNGRFVKRIKGDDDLPTKKMQAVDIPIAIDPKSDKNNERKNEEVYYDDEKDVKKSHFGLWFAIIASMLIIGAVVYIGINFVIPSLNDDANKFTVDNYVKQDIEIVKQELTAKKINVTENRVFNESIQKGIIISQDVTPGQELKLDGYNTIVFDVSDGPETLRVPDLQNKEERLAEIDLKEKGFSVTVVDEYNDTVAKGSVIRTTPSFDVDVKPGSDVTVFRSLGPEVKQVNVPDLTGKTMKEALDILQASNLTMGTVYPKDTTSEIATIKSQSPLPNTLADANSPVDIYMENYGTTGKIVDLSVVLTNPGDYGNTIKLYIESISSDTLVPQPILDKPSVDKGLFPVKFSITVPINGSTKVRVFLDDKLFSESTYM